MLDTLEIKNFRCIEHVRIHLDPKCSIFVGGNAAGKTSLLEAIFALSRGRSFKTPSLLNAIRTGQDSMQLIAELEPLSRQHIGIQFSRRGCDARLNGERLTSFATLATAMPVTVIDPGTHKLLEEGPILRREFVDWGTFHVEPRFVAVWRNYRRALAHRNAALKQGDSGGVLGSWDGQLAETGTQVSQFRERYLEVLRPYVSRYADILLGTPVILEFIPGWKLETSLSSALVSSIARDQQSKTTNVGPHRADISVLIDYVPARYRVSRGQQKLLACALILAQLHCHADVHGRPACLLLDDPAAELDVENLGKLLSAVSQVPAQLIMTALDGQKVSALDGAKMFHVERGVVT